MIQKDHEYEVVEDHPHLIRDTYSKAISNRDTDAYDKYMAAATKRKERNSQLVAQRQEINNIKEEMSEMKDMLGQILNKVNGN
tara:strand:+ start:232 stop:480 length:249 start_codon:yes stop_codon:yes gene_type:complete